MNDRLLEDHGKVVLQLQGLFREFAEVEKARASAYSNAYWDTDHTSHASAKEAGRLASLPLYLDKLDVQAKIDAAIESRDHLRLQLQYGGERDQGTEAG